MYILKISLYVWIHIKIIPENFAFLISSYSPVKLIFLLKSRLLCNVFYCFCVFVNKYVANFAGKKLEDS